MCACQALFERRRAITLPPEGGSLLALQFMTFWRVIKDCPSCGEPILSVACSSVADVARQHYKFIPMRGAHLCQVAAQDLQQEYEADESEESLLNALLTIQGRG
jgi:hypothetical protein